VLVVEVQVRTERLQPCSGAAVGGFMLAGMQRAMPVLHVLRAGANQKKVNHNARCTLQISIFHIFVTVQVHGWGAGGYDHESSGVGHYALFYP
jgi:hypothetical protein